jgi:hypothetical protein
MSVGYKVVSIGTLSSNPFWSEPPGVRTAHATTTLVTDGERRILVDPSLPAMALVSRLFERAGLAPDAVTDVFCTTLRPTHRRAIEAFGAARWLCPPGELEAFDRHLRTLAEAAGRGRREVEEDVAAELKLIERFEPAPDRITESVHLFPLPGTSAGSAGLLLAGARLTVMIAGDAAPTIDHVLAGRVWSGCADAKAAMESMSEVLEIADFIICGHDNVMPNPTRWMA